jgi:adenine-specific DNA-methyltransferase
MSFSLGDYTPPEGQRWQAGEDVINQLNNDGYIEFRDGTPFRRYFEDEEGAEHDPFYCFMEVDWTSTSEAGKNQLNEILGNQHGFDTVKPVRLLKTLVQACTSREDSHLVMDFFGGSGTTAHAVMQLNSEDGGNRKFILVQVAEPSITKSGEAKYETISELCKERIRRVGAFTLAGDTSDEWNKDIGFRVLKIDTSNMADVHYSPDALGQAHIDSLIDNIKPDRTAEDLLFQVMLDWGVDLALPIARQDIQGKEVFLVDSNALVACFDDHGGVDDSFVKELAQLEPLRVVFRDAGFKDSAMKINVEQIFKLLSPSTEVKCL